MSTELQGLSEERVDRSWWKEAVVYQIYPRSFNDSNGDGIGDIPGIIEKVDYLDDLGVDVVWLSPVYESPNADNGYDISDYRSIMDEMGTLEDWQALLDALHERDIKLVMDLVVNHTSDEHEWFRKSRREEDGYGDFYHWVEGSPDEPPNNWESFFGGSAWSYDEERGAWYLHLFDEKQPDLNWDNPAVREAVHDTVQWWLDRGIDGFRMDVINLNSKPEGYPDGDPEGGLVGSEHFVDGSEVTRHLRELYDDVISNYDVMTVGEMPQLDVDTASEYLGEDGAGLNMAFHFDHTSLDFGPEGRWDVGDWELTELKEIFTRWQENLDGWNTLYFGNHDQPRPVSRYGDDDRFRYESATLMATLTLTMRGTPFVYQGEELGLPNAEFKSLSELRDVDTINPVENMLDRGEIDSYDDIKTVVNHRTRDNARTPMHWRDEVAAGFTDGEPWIKVNERYPEINAADQRAREDSVFAYYQDLIDLRSDEDTLVYGDYDLLLPEDDAVYAYTRTLGEDRLLIVLNWSDTDQQRDLAAAVGTDRATVLLANTDDVGTDLGSLSLSPFDARVYRL